MKQILYIEVCNFQDYPLGGHLSFALHLTAAMKGDIDIAGIRTDNELKEGCWDKCEIAGYNYNFFNIGNFSKSFKKPIIPTRITDFLCIKRHIKQILKHKEYDIIIVQTPETLFCLPKAYRRRTCLIMPGVGNPLSISRYKWARAFASVYDKVFFRYAKEATHILAAADQQAITEFVVRGKGTILPERVFQFPTRYDADIFHLTEKSDARRTLGIPSGATVFVTTGRLNWFKGWKFMIDAFAIFKKQTPDAVLYFLGKGEDELKINEYIKQLNLQESVILAGVHPLPTVAQYLNAADLFIMGSYREGWSTSLVEAIACGKACVVTEFSSAHDLVKDGENGFVQVERNEDDFAALMSQALKLPCQQIEKHTQAAYGFSVQTMRQQLNKILQFE
ncbi:MAG: glycosyltransferase [Bacteroidales bacterium]|nr:glycosyltransferase [Bacteroidales bacterium]